MIELAENEKWIPGMEGDYSADTTGEVYSYKRGNKSKLKGGVTYRTTRGKKKVMYRLLCMYGPEGVFNEYVHRLVGKTFLPDFSEDLTINHINGDKLDNRVENLECITLQDNSKHAWEIGLVKIGDNGLSTEEADKRALDFCNGVVDGPTIMYKKYVKEEHLLKFGLPIECLEFSFPKSKFNNMLEYWESTVRMFKDMEDGMTLGSLQMKYGLDQGALCKIRAKKSREKEWTAYERIKKSLYEKLILENS